MASIRTRARGELESEVMRLLWEENQPVGAHDLQKKFADPQPAYTTLMTALSRLEKKGRVVRSGDSPRKVRFIPSRSDEEYASETMMTALGEAGDRRAALLAFAGNLNDEDLDLLRASFGPASE